MLTIKKPFAILTCVVAGLVAGNAAAADNGTFTAPKAQIKPEYRKLDFSKDKRAAAKHFAAQYDELKGLFSSELDYDNLALDVSELSKNSRLDVSSLKSFESHVIAAKSFPSDTQGLVELRLADKSMLSLIKNGVAPLFAYEPEGDEKSWQYVEAFDINGNSHLLDVYEMPTQPVVVVDINNKKDLKEGLKLMREVFRTHGGKYSLEDVVKSASASATLETTVLKQIRVNDDQEPWLLGKAEMYGVVNGVNADRVEPELDVVDMPYLDYDDTTYYPNQIVIYWARYRWAAADMIIMEADGNVNYKDLALTLLDIAGTILRTIPDPTVQGYAIIPQLTSQLIKAMPDSWWTNDDDYVDVLYTILKNTTYTNHYGASANAKVTLAPLNIASQ